MMDLSNIKVGDKVIRNYGLKLGMGIGTVVNITPKRRDIVVDYDNYKETYDKFGGSKGDSVYCRNYIRPLTPEILEEIKQRNLIAKCRDVFEKKKDLTADQARRILEILMESETE